MRSGPGEARTILLLHIISVRPSKQPLMVRTFLKVYMELGSYFLFLQEKIKDIIIICPEPVLTPCLVPVCSKQPPSGQRGFNPAFGTEFVPQYVTFASLRHIPSGYCVHIMLLKFLPDNAKVSVWLLTCAIVPGSILSTTGGIKKV